MKTFKLSFPKIYYLIERYVMLNKKSIVITASSLTGVLVALCLLNTWAGNHVFSVDYFVLQAKLFFVIPGFVFTSVIFKEISSFANGWSYFILPANRIEKMVAYWLLTTVVYIIFSLSILIISSLIISGLVSLLFEPTFFVFNPLNFQFQELIVHYLVLQSVYFLGAISFQRNHFFITTLFVLLVLGFLVLFSILGFRLIFGDWSIFLNADTVSPEFFEQIKLWIKVIYYGLLAPFFLLMSYLRFKEKEI